jgi:hypothetical protein
MWHKGGNFFLQIILLFLIWKTYRSCRNMNVKTWFSRLSQQVAQPNSTISHGPIWPGTYWLKLILNFPVESTPASRYTQATLFSIWAQLPTHFFARLHNVDIYNAKPLLMQYWNVMKTQNASSTSGLERALYYLLAMVDTMTRRICKPTEFDCDYAFWFSCNVCGAALVTRSADWHCSWCPREKHTRDFREAAYCGNDVHAVKKALAEHRANPASENNYALRWAARRGHLNIVKLLLADYRVDVSAFGQYALGMAAAHGHLHMVRELLKHPRVEPEANNNYALKVALWNGYDGIVDMLLRCVNVRASLPMPRILQVKITPKRDWVLCYTNK